MLGCQFRHGTCDFQAVASRVGTLDPSRLAIRKHRTLVLHESRESQPTGQISCQYRLLPAPCRVLPAHNLGVTAWEATRHVLLNGGGQCALAPNHGGSRRPIPDGSVVRSEARGESSRKFHPRRLGGASSAQCNSRDETCRMKTDQVG